MFIQALISLFCVVSAYMLGTVPVRRIIMKRIMGITDLRADTPGWDIAHIIRIAGFPFAVFAVVSEMSKGFIAVYAATALSLSPAVIAMSGAAAVCGHAWPFMYGFKGDNSVIPCLGAILYMAAGTLFTAVLSGLAFGWIWQYTGSWRLRVSPSDAGLIFCSLLMPLMAYYNGTALHKIYAMLCYGALVFIERYARYKKEHKSGIYHTRLPRLFVR